MSENVKKTKKFISPMSFYITGGVFLIYALLFPFYKISHFLMGAVIALAAFVLSSALLPKQEAEIPTAPVKTGNTAADEAVREGQEYMAQLAAIRRNINEPKVTASLASIDDTVGKILRAVIEDTKKVSQVRRLIGYYLPTLIKLADFYEKLENHGTDGENIGGSMERIEGNILTLDSALKKQLDVLYESDALDISTDITVMENMLAQEGLSGESLNDRLQQMGGNE